VDNEFPESSGPQSFDPGTPARLAVLLGIALLFLVYCALRPGGVRAQVEEIERLLGRKNDAAPTAPPKNPRRAQGTVDAMTPQAQAELLLDEAVHNEEGALEDLNARLDGWRGYLQMTPRLSQEMVPALNASDLQVRAACLEIFLDVYDVAKQPESVSTLEQRISAEPDARPWALFSLGALGNRGIDPIGVRRKLEDYANDPNGDTRAWAMEGLAILGTNEAIDPLLESLRNDPSPNVKDRAACGLAQSGMFTHEQRMSAVPRLLDMAEDASLDATARGFVYHALQDITQGNQGSDARAWRRWWNEHQR